MNIAAPSSITGDEAEAARRLSDSAKTLTDPALRNFAEGLFRNAAPEDINRFSPEALSELTRAVFKRAAVRKKGEGLADIFAPGAEDQAYPKNESVLVAINDDMPFLFDSLIGELNAQGARLRAVFHPIIMLAGTA